MRGQGHATGRSLPPGKTRYALYRRLGGPQGRSGQVRKISPPTGIRFPDRPARSQSLYRLSYPAHSHTCTFPYFLAARRERDKFGENYGRNIPDIFRIVSKLPNSFTLNDLSLRFFGPSSAICDVAVQFSALIYTKV